MASTSDLDTSSNRYTVFATKIQPPRLRIPLVVRPRLIDRLKTTVNGWNKDCRACNCVVL